MRNLKKIDKKIIEVLEKIRPFLISDGGDVEYIKFEDGIAYIHLIGQCSECSLMDTTLKDGIEVAIVNEVPEVIEVRNIANND